MTKNQEYTEEEVPNEWEDWGKAVESNPDSWGDVFLDNMQYIVTYQWKEQESFLDENGVTSLFPSLNSYQTFKDLKELWQLENIFILPEQKYSLLFGTTGNFTYYNPQTIERTYTLVWTETIEIPGGEVSITKDGNTTTIILPPETVEKEHSEEKTQTLENINISRYLPLQDGYMESYWVMDKRESNFSWVMYWK